MEHSLTIRTVGHSNRTLDDFLALLGQHGVERIVDVRAFPGSRKHPHFGQDALRTSLAEARIDYSHLRSLGGRRGRPAERRPELGGAWRNASFQAYAHHMHEPEFAHGVTALEELAATQAVALMCSEAVPWRCHRWLVSDALVARGHEVLHVVGPGKPRAHSVTGFAEVREGVVRYPATQL